MTAPWRVIGLGLVLALGVLWIASADRSVPPADVGAPAPVFTLPDLAGTPVALSDFRGRVVLLNFWATWCGPCEQEMPAMERLTEALPSEDFALVAVSVDDDAEDVRTFREDKGLTFTILHDADKEAAGLYQSFRYPESFLIDRDGTLVARYIGPREWDEPAYRGRIERMIGSGSTEPAAPPAGG